MTPYLCVKGHRTAWHFWRPLALQKRNLARRFIVLIDELYNAKVSFICTAAAAPEKLFTATAEDDQPVFDPEQLEQLQFESAAEGASP